MDDNSLAGICIALIVLLVALVASAGTDTGSSWYQTLYKPDWQPPPWMFGVAWTAIYIMFAVSAILVWTSSDGTVRLRLMVLFAINAVLNAAWSFIFFKARMPVAAGFDIVGLAMVLAVMIVRIWPVSPTAAVLLLPYLVWVVYASVLNWAIARMN